MFTCPYCNFLTRHGRGLLTFAVALVIPTLVLSYYGPHLFSSDRAAEQVADAAPPRVLEVARSTQAGVPGHTADAPALDSYLWHWTYTSGTQGK